LLFAPRIKISGYAPVGFVDKFIISDIILR